LQAGPAHETISAAAAGEAGGAACGNSSSSGSVALLPNLRSFFMKNCLIGAETLQLLLGLQSGASASCSSSSGGVGASQLARLSVTGDQAGHGEVSEAWPEWVAAVKQLTSLQVRPAISRNLIGLFV
jgi:hypothetical protein